MTQPAQPELPLVGGGSTAFLAALLAASRSDCGCQACQILRSIADTVLQAYKVKKGE